MLRFPVPNERMAKAKAPRANTRSTLIRGPRGRTGHIGPRGPVGPAGPAGKDYESEIALLVSQVAELEKALQIQLTRIGQIQAQLDRLASGSLIHRRGRRRVTDRTKH